MSWVIAAALAIGAFALAVFVLRAPRGGWEAIAAALIFGIAGYAFQGSPGIPAAPTTPREPVSDDRATIVEARGKVGKSGIPPNDRWIIIADGLARNGQYADAAEVLRGAIEANPRNGEAWLAMANALVAHADGSLTPASLYAFRRAAAATPDQPGPPFFLGLALAQSGRLEEARTLWRHLLSRTPPEAPWGDELKANLERLDAIIAAQQSAPGAPGPR